MPSFFLLSCRLITFFNLNFKIYFKQIQTVKGFINGDNDVIDTYVADHYIKDASIRLKNSLEHYLIAPRDHLQSYS